MTLVIALHQVEGEEADKVLAFFPRDVKPNNQSAVVGLVQAMLAFSSIFSQVRSQAVAGRCAVMLALWASCLTPVLQDAPCEAMHAEHSRWFLHQCEPHLWMLLVSAPSLCQPCDRQPAALTACSAASVSGRGCASIAESRERWPAAAPGELRGAVRRARCARAAGGRARLAQRPVQRRGAGRAAPAAARAAAAAAGATSAPARPGERAGSAPARPRCVPAPAAAGRRRCCQPVAAAPSPGADCGALQQRCAAPLSA